MLAACILFLIVLKIVIKILLITNKKIKHTVSGLSQKKKLIYKTILTYEDLILQRS